MNFGIGDPNSTSGFLVPTTYIFAKNNVEPSTVLQDRAQRQPSKQMPWLLPTSRSMLPPTTPKTCAGWKAPIRTPSRTSRLIWKSPLIPSDPLVWRKELDADVKSKVYTFVMTYGRIGSPEEVADARKVLDEAAVGTVPSVFRRPAVPDPHSGPEQGHAESARRREDELTTRRRQKLAELQTEGRRNQQAGLKPYPGM
jgi:hypothetical protein